MLPRLLLLATGGTSDPAVIASLAAAATRVKIEEGAVNVNPRVNPWLE